MRMKMQILAPRMQNREEPDRRAKTFGIGCDREQRFGCGAD
jgi:hypothetical protein